MGSNWQTYTLDELYDVSSGLSKKKEEFGFGYPFLTFKEVFHNIFVPEVLPELANTTENERERCSIKRGDVFLTRTSEKLEELGLSCVALKDYKNATFNGFTKRLRPNGFCEEILLPEFAAFFFSSDIFRKQVTSFASMTTRASLNNEIISKLKITIPTIREQKIISRILSDLLKKELLNTEITTNLEEISQKLFEQWFVKYKIQTGFNTSNPAKENNLIESNIDYAPNGWQVKKLKDILKIKSGYAFKSKWWKTEGTPVVKIKDITEKGLSLNNLSYVDEDVRDIAKNYLVEGGEILIALTGATAGKMSVVPMLERKVLVNQRVGIVKSLDEDVTKMPFLYCLLKSDKINHFIKELALGSAQPNISPIGLSEIEVYLPEDTELINRFNLTIFPQYKMILELHLENIKLNQLRNILLQKLLSGEIEIPDESVVESS